MMNNITRRNHVKLPFFRRYLLGESLENILIRLIIILSASIIIWCCMMLIQFLRIRYQRRKQMEKILNLEENCRYNSSLTSISSIKWYSNREITNENSIHSREKCSGEVSIKKNDLYPSAHKRKISNVTNDIPMVNHNKSRRLLIVILF
jgi:hypothetical protein